MSTDTGFRWGRFPRVVFAAIFHEHQTYMFISYNSQNKYLYSVTIFLVIKSSDYFYLLSGTVLHTYPTTGGNHQIAAQDNILKLFNY